MGRLRQRWTATVLALGVVLAATAIGPAGAAPPAGAVLTPSTTHGAPGDTITVGVSGCSGEDDEIYRSAQVRILTGGAEPTVVAFGESYDGRAVELTLPDWYEPGSARLVADCLETEYGDEGPETISLFSYTAIELDLMPGTGPARQTLHLGRTSVAEGQVIPVDVTGCDPVGADGYAAAYVVVYEGVVDAATWLDLRTQVASGYAQAQEDGTARIELAVIGNYRPLTVGPHTVLGLCERGGPATTRQTFLPMQELTVTATNPATRTLDASYRIADGELTISGEGCTGGDLVTLRIHPDPWDDENQVQARSEAAAPARSLDEQLARVTEAGPSTRAAIHEVVVTPAEDGTWSHDWEVPPPGAQYVEVDGDCGDALADGFRYAAAFTELGGWSAASVSRVNPTTSPVDGPLTVQVTGDCPEDQIVTVEVADYEGEVFSSGTTNLHDRFGSVDVQAPPEAGAYSVGARCVASRGGSRGLQVFEPGAPRSPDPVPPAPPATGWPSAGPVEHFTGRIGPIDLPVGHDMPMASDGRALPPSGISVGLPRPEGEFAIRSIEFDLVDADTEASVPREDAHLHHFVMADTTDTNPACPSGTFGLPGQIIGAVGQERSRIGFADPYGLVVEADDAWGGTYDLMNLGHEAREVYLTYELTLQRDVSKIRPVTPYFFSANGCSSFDWTIDGSGTKDVQSTYVEIEKDGLLTGGGGHVHNGGEATELYDDRDRLVCRSELHVGDGDGGHGGHGAMSSDRQRPRADEVATTMHPTTSMNEGTTTSMVPPPGESGYPPEFYPDDPPIEHISGCPAINQPVTAGERLRFDAIYTNERPRSGVMGIGTFFVWEGGGPADPITGPVIPPGSVPPGNTPPVVGPNTPSKPPSGNAPKAPPAKPVSGRAKFTG